MKTFELTDVLESWYVGCRDEQKSSQWPMFGQCKHLVKIMHLNVIFMTCCKNNGCLITIGCSGIVFFLFSTYTYINFSLSFFFFSVSPQLYPDYPFQAFRQLFSRLKLSIYTSNAFLNWINPMHKSHCRHCSHFIETMQHLLHCQRFIAMWWEHLPLSPSIHNTLFMHLIQLMKILPVFSKWL